MKKLQVPGSGKDGNAIVTALGFERFTLERLKLGTARGRALRLRCPRCGGGKLFHGWFKMYETCPNCKLKYERSPGYFLGSIYVGYGLTALIVTISYVVTHFGLGWSNGTVVGPLLAFCVIFPLFFHRYARALWLAMDLYFDQSDDTM